MQGYSADAPSKRVILLFRSPVALQDFNHIKDRHCSGLTTFTRCGTRLRRHEFVPLAR
jgi:hypothetical protein